MTRVSKESENKMYFDKIAVFDLDDTLYISNSHIEILSRYYDTKFFKSIAFRIIGKFLPTIHLYIMNKLYFRIPDSYKIKFTLPFNRDITALLFEKKREGYKVIIVSNAPTELIKVASKRLGVDYIKADFSQKGKELCRIYSFGKLFVCTDNKTDIDLLKLADEAVVTCKNKHKSYFEKKVPELNITFSEIRDSYKFGCEKFGPFLYGYTMWLIDQLREKNIDKVYFFSRDGYMMKKAFDTINDEKEIESYYTYVSRRSLREPLLHYCNNYKDSLRYITWNRFISIKACLEYYGFTTEECEQLAKEYNIDLGQDISFSELEQNRILEQIFNDRIDIIKRRSAYQDKMLKIYLSSQNFIGRVAIVDIGWHGSMQLYLEEYIKLSGIKVEIIGFYVGMDPPDKLLGKTFGYLFSKHNDYMRKRVLCFLGVLERLFQSMEGSTNGYDDSGKVIIGKYEYENDEVIKSKIIDFQIGAMEYVYAEQVIQNE